MGVAARRGVEELALGGVGVFEVLPEVDLVLHGLGLHVEGVELRQRGVDLYLARCLHRTHQQHHPQCQQHHYKPIHMMRVIKIPKYGRSPILTQAPLPHRAPNQLLIRMKYAPINPSDLNFYLGQYGVRK